MKYSEKKQHWEHIYETKNVDEVSWYQTTPKTSLEFIERLGIAKSAKLIDIGAGDSFLVDHLLKLGFTDITVLDISKTALNKAQTRLGDQAKLVKWIEADAALFKSTEKYDFWHDRAAFHFITEENEIENYISNLERFLKPAGKVVIGTFSTNGPKKCSGIEISQYSESSLTDRLSRYFEKIECRTVDHITPFGTEQNFVFCSFRKLPDN